MSQPPHAWIDRDDLYQLKWILDYLGRYKVDIVVPTTLDPHYLAPSYQELIDAIDKRMPNPVFRERYRKMQAAWRQAKSRRNPGRRTVNFHMSNEALSYLNKLAEERGEAKLHLLEQMIRNRWYEHDRAAKEIQKNKNTYQARLKDQRSQYEEERKRNRNIISGLLNELAENMSQLSYMEAIIGECDDEPMDKDTLVRYKNLLQKKATNVNINVSYLKMLRPPGGTLKQRIERLIPVS